MSKTTSKKTLMKIALSYAQRGWAVLPLHGVARGKCQCSKGADCTRAGKHPCTKNGVKDATSNAKRVEKWWGAHPEANIAIATGKTSGILVLDRDGKLGLKSLLNLIKKYGPLPKTVRVSTPRGEHIYFSHPGGKVRNLVAFRPGLDIRGDGGYVVGAGSRGANGKSYKYKAKRAPGEAKIAKVPEWLLSILKPSKAGPTVTDAGAPIAKFSGTYGARALELEAGRVANAPNHQRNHSLNRGAFRMGQLVAGGALTEPDVQASLTRAALMAGLGEAEVRKSLDSGLKAGIKQPRKAAMTARTDHLAKDLAKLGQTDAHNAERFVRRFHDRVIWTGGLGWLVYDGRRWAIDDHNKRLKLAVETTKAIKDEVPYLKQGWKAKRRKFSNQSLSKQALDKLLATAQPDLSTDDAKLDTEVNLFNVLNGTLDLKTGVLHPHNPADMITRLCPVNFRPKAKCPLFLTFLKKATGGNKDIMRFLKKAAGYSLTGECSEQVLFFLFGPTRTGKSTFINLLRDLVGDYGINTPTKTLLMKHYDNDIPVDLARMKGARVVTASENNPNQQLDEAKVKSMTGGDKQTARFMRQNPFDFQPEFKLWIAANDRPKVRATDDAIWNRFIVLPFNNQVEDDRDDDLPKKLRTELEGILAWAVRGAVLWHKERLSDRTIFDAETNRWKAQCDTVGRFFHECCQATEPSEAIQSSVFYRRYEQWCKTNAEKPSTAAVFKAGMIQLNVAWKKTNKGAVYLGVKLIK